MSKNFVPKYKVFTNNKNIVKVGCSDAGQMYYGIARCNPEDEFDYEFGYKLAKLRCDEKIHYQKWIRSSEICDFYQNIVDEASYILEREYEYKTEHFDEYITDVEEIDKLLGVYEE